MSLTVTAVLLVCLAVAKTAELPRLGLSLSQPEPRIVGGRNASVGQFPYQVSLQWGFSPVIPYQHFCGGIILEHQWILTAAQCVRIVPNIGSFVIKAGKHNISKVEFEEQLVSVNKSFIHPNYTGGVAPYDIALLKLSRPLIFNRYVSNATLPRSNLIYSGNATVIGWGSTSKSPRPLMPQILQYANVPVLTLSNCRKAIEIIIGRSPLHETNICTGPLTGGYSACTGDAGGPLISQRYFKPEVIGIVSWGIIPCGNYGAPTIYTKTSAFIDWITTTIKRNS